MDYPKMIYLGGDLSAEYRIVAGEEELAAAADDGFFPHDQVKPTVDPFLDRPVDKIKADLEGLSVEQLTAYRELEEGSAKPRAGLLKAIEAAVTAKQAA